TLVCHPQSSVPPAIVLMLRYRRSSDTPTFSCHLPCPPRDLRSFPTRRSSDLPIEARVLAYQARAKYGRPITPSWMACIPSMARGLERRWVPICTRRGPSDARAPSPSRRSEEHTSELQSRFDLVCRLLLEKKKT